MKPFSIPPFIPVLVLIFLAVLQITALHAQSLQDEQEPRWIRYQQISPDAQHIAFVYKGDIYTVPSEGGEAKQLTFHTAHDTRPVWSRDGSKIAFASDRFGNFDIYVMDSRGGEAQRLTFHSNNEQPTAFYEDDRSILFQALRQDHHLHRQFPVGHQPELYAVPAGGGRVQQILSTPALEATLSPNSQWLLYEDAKGGEDPWRKKHRSSVARDIWVYDTDTESHRQLTGFVGEDRNPVWNETADSLFYLSERDGSFNVFSMPFNHEEEHQTEEQLGNPDQSAEQLTFFDLHPVRFLSHARGLLAFGYHGELYTMRPGEEPSRVPVVIRSQNAENDTEILAVNGDIEEMAISPNGKEIAFITRGDVFVTSKEGDFTKQITSTPEQESFVTFTPDGSGIVYAGERNGGWTIYKTEIVRENEPLFYASTLLQESVLISADVDVYQPAFSPDSAKIAYIADRRILRVQDLETGTTTDLLDRNDLFHRRDGDQYFKWSPDSRWILVGWDKYLHNSEVLLLAADGSVRQNLTQSGYSDEMPKWMPNGEGLIWFSNRDGKRSYATSGSSESDIYAMFLTQKAWDHYSLSEEEKELLERIESIQGNEGSDQNGTSNGKKVKKRKRKQSSGETTFTPELERASDRTARLTRRSGMMSDAVLSKDGETLYYLARFENDFQLWKTSLRSGKTEIAVQLNNGRGSLHWDPDYDMLYLLSRGSIEALNLKNGKAKRVSVRGEMKRSASREKEALLEHIYIRTKNIFYTSDFHGNDWELLYEEYKPLVKHVGNYYEFAELVSEWIGELNVSHARARYSRSTEKPDATASLGILKDYAHEGNGILIAEILAGGPLDKAALSVKPGMIILSVNGNAITPEIDEAALLNRLEDTFTQLELLDPVTGNRQQITARPISQSEERRLLYDRYVDINEKEVEEKSDGRLGYVHIPGMGDGPYRNIIEDMLGRFDDRDAIIVDTRFNSGGDLVADLAMFFTGVKFNSYSIEDRDIGGEPTSRWTKPTLSLFNEAMYSDGHCYASAYTELGIGITVGMPVPGTCSWAGWERLPNGFVWGVVPVSAKNMSGEWMENNQTEPQYRVKNRPETIADGRDEQLEEGIRLLLDQVKNP